MRRTVFILTSFVGASCILSSCAATTGGTPIANAPVLSSRASPYRVDLSSDQADNGHSVFWVARLTRGELFSLNGTGSPDAASFDARIFPAGTDAATLRRSHPIVQSRLSTAVGFTAPRSGTYPIEIVCATSQTCGSMKFFVSITQGIVLSVPGSADLTLSGTFTVTVRTPEGRPVTSRRLAVDLYGLWNDNFATPTHHVLGSSEAVDGKASFRYTLPDSLTGQTISLQATTSSRGYSPASSALCQAKVI